MASLQWAKVDELMGMVIIHGTILRLTFRAPVRVAFLEPGASACFSVAGVVIDVVDAAPRQLGAELIAQCGQVVGTGVSETLPVTRGTLAWPGWTRWLAARVCAWRGRAIP